MNKIRNTLRRITLARANPFSGWLILLAMLIIALITVSAIYALRQGAEKLHKIVLLLTRIEGQANRLSALEWHAVSDSAIGAHDGTIAPEILGGMQEARPVEDAIAELKRCAGTQFDPQVVETFIEMPRTE